MSSSIVSLEPQKAPDCTATTRPLKETPTSFYTVPRVFAAKPFEPHPLLRNGHAQTLAGWAWPRRFRLSSPTEDEVRLFEVEPGVRLLARCRWHENRAD